MTSNETLSLWASDMKSIIETIDEATEKIIYYRQQKKASTTERQKVWKHVKGVCDSWASKTYVGEEKEHNQKHAFHNFFQEFLNLLLVMKEHRNACEKRIANKILFTGHVYRYLGNNHPSNKIICPNYDSIYVSWSKNPENHYLLTKLYGTVTWMACEIVEPYYGIDLEALGCSRGSECEVVFPTIEKCVTEIKYLSEEDDD